MPGDVADVHVEQQAARLEMVQHFEKFAAAAERPRFRPDSGDIP